MTIMSNSTSKYCRAFAMILFFGILFAALLEPHSSFAEESTLETQSSEENIQEQQDVLPEDLPLDLIEPESGIQTTSNDSYDLGYAEDNDNSNVEDLVLAVTTDKKLLSEGVFAIQKNGEYYFPVAALSEILDFYYDIDTSIHTVDGWALFEEDSYFVDVQNKRLRFRGEEFDLPSEAFIGPEVADDDIYILSGVLSQIWPAQFEVNLSSLVLDIIPDKPLPFQTALVREKQRARTEERRAERLEGDDFPFIPYPYQFYTKPTIDISASTGYDDAAEHVFGGLSVNGVNDLAYASADYSAAFAHRNGEFQNPENIRFRLRRQNIHEGALPYGLEDTQLGDVNLSNRELISNNVGGRGFLFSTESSNKSGEFDLITIDGIGTPGWEVELYLNNELLNFGVIDDRGEYRFEDISVGFGNNRFRIVLYGPQGQIKERVENYIYQSSMIEKGKNVFSGGIVDGNEDLIPIDKRRTGLREGLAANIYAARGIKEKLTAFFTANTIRDRDGNNTVSREYLSAGAIGSVGTTLAKVEGYKQLDGGQALEVRTLSDFKGFKVNAQISAFSDFESPHASNGDNAKTLETDISVKKIFRTAIGALGLELRQNYTKRKKRDDVSDYITRQSLGIGPLRMTNTTRSSFSDGEHQLSTGRFGASTRRNKWNFRNSLDYNISPDPEVTSFQTELRYRANRDFSMAARANYSFINDQKGLGFQISRDYKKFLGSMDIDWQSTTGVGFTLRASTSLGPYGEDGTYAYRGNPLSNVGPVNSFLYTDKNYDGTYDDSDEPLEDTRVIVNRRISREETDESGNLMQLISVGSKKTKIKVAKESIDDPYLVSSVPGYRIYPRPGVVHQLEFPLIETGAIDGTLRWSDEGKPIAGVTLQLLDEEADILRETQTGFDGYFTFEQIPPGNYTIRPDPEEGIDIPFKYVNLTPDDLFQFGIDMSATPNTDVAEIDLDMDVAQDGTLNVKDIISLAKGYKDKRSGKVYKVSTSDNPANTAIQNNIKQTGQTNVKHIRIGEHPNKVRVVLDLSAPVKYSIHHDPQSNSIFVELLFARSSAVTSWDSKERNILYNYHTEATDQGVRLILGVEDGVAIGASGLLKADGGRNDRLYIDIEKKQI